MLKNLSPRFVVVLPDLRPPSVETVHTAACGHSQATGTAALDICTQLATALSLSPLLQTVKTGPDRRLLRTAEAQKHVLRTELTNVACFFSYCFLWHTLVLISILVVVALIPGHNSSYPFWISSLFFTDTAPTSFALICCHFTSVKHG